MLSALLTLGVYAAEDAFPEAADSLDVVAGDRRRGGRHGRLIFPQALGVGYDTIGALLQGDVPRTMIARCPAGEIGHLGRSRWARERPAACWRRC